MENKQFIEELVQQHDRKNERIAFRVGSKMAAYQVYPVYIVQRHGLLQLKYVKFFTDTDIFFYDVLIDHSSRIQIQDKFAQLVAYFRKIIAKASREQSSAFRCYGITLNLQLFVYPCRDLTI